MLKANQEFYDPLWKSSRLIRPERFNTWPLVSDLAGKCPRRLEVGPGLRPRLPLKETRFLDSSEVAVAKLRNGGADALAGLISALPFPDGSFDLVCALDIIEHVDGDDSALAELARVSAPGATFLVAVPLHAASWTPFDDFVGHRRRYDPCEFLTKLEEHGFAVEESATYGMQTKSSRLVGLGMWCLTNRPGEAMWWYNNIFMPLGLWFQKPLKLIPGMVNTENVDQILLVCRKTAG